MEQAKKILATHKYKVKDVGSFVGYKNQLHFSSEFKKYTGFSPNDYLITLRINRAKSMLKNTTLPAAKIAHEVGIHDLNNFTNLFKKKTGMTPILFRNSNLIS